MTKDDFIYKAYLVKMMTKWVKNLQINMISISQQLDMSPFNQTLPLKKWLKSLYYAKDVLISVWCIEQAHISRVNSFCAVLSIYAIVAVKCTCNLFDTFGSMF